MFFIFRLCERLGITPPEVKPSWNENSAFIQERLLAYESIRQQEEMEVTQFLATAGQMKGL